ncbi:MAG: hypothetical protein ACON39_02070 [Coraliomargaritaceae bacterium]
MHNSNEPTDKKVQLEDLLRFKQAEQPDAAYWSRFDRELHQRMLHTLVKKDPLYRQVLRAFTGKLFPVGMLATATAALAIVVGLPSPQSVSTSQPVLVTLPASAEASVVSISHVEVVDYAIDAISVGEADFQRDFGMDRMESSELSQADYSVQDVAAPRSGGPMLASLTF